ncbi:hypothetical protein ACQR1I_04950 [Bradyrhizobium sp. HKCCYLS2038]|uniref:hypothetical protein n=1 Tax=Bradyrhizobium sp. HKCCYLS2038 TaxID=3420764 RepID=UPI003EBC28AF
MVSASVEAADFRPGAAAKTPPLCCLFGFGSLTQTNDHKKLARRLIGMHPMKRPRPMVRTSIEAAANAAVSTRFLRKPSSGPGHDQAPGLRDLHCRVVDGGSGHAVRRVHGHGTPAHAGG